MIPNSLRIRLLVAASVVIVIALQVAGGSLQVVFERNLIRQFSAELEADIEHIAANVQRVRGGGVDLAGELADPRFRQPYGGRYWQVSVIGQPKLRSRSLWDEELWFAKLPSAKDGVRYGRIRGPSQQKLYAAARGLILVAEAPDEHDIQLQIVVAMDEVEIENLKHEFWRDLLTALGLLAILLIAASWVQVAVGLMPLETIRAGLTNVRLGREHRLSTAVPGELAPLVTETNRLLEAQEKVITRARTRAGDLAHGVKTPLTALTMMADQLREEGREQFATAMKDHLRGINAQVERELARARIAAGAGVAHRTQIAPLLRRLLQTMRTLPNGADREWSVDCPQNLKTTLDETDLMEALGNLLDNARKWAKSSVDIHVEPLARYVRIVVTDDGPGVPEEKRREIATRGLRLDETVPGSGLGLSIVKDIVESYGGEIEFGAAPSGGLVVRLDLPVSTELDVQHAL